MIVLQPTADPRARTAAPRLLAALAFAAYATLSVRRHLQLRSTGYDLGIFEQAVRAYAHLHAPVAPLKGPGFNLLGDHFHPILIILAPLYRLAPSPLTLLLAQAALLAVSVVPVTRAAQRAATPAAGTAIGAAYALSFGLQQAVAFDFHEVAFAVPLLSWSLGGYLDARPRAAVLRALPLLLVKEDLPLTVAALGLVLARRRATRRLGLATAVLGIVATALIVLVVLPAFSPYGRDSYLSAAQPTSADPLTRLLLPERKWWTLVTLFAPTAFLALRSPLALLTVPTLAWRFWVVQPAYWGLQFHYSAVLMPIVFLAMADALRNRSHRTAGRAAAAAIAVTLALLPTLPLAELAWWAWQSPPGAVAAREVLAEVPAGADVAASNRLAAQLTSRATVWLYPQALERDRLRPEWIVLTGTDTPDAPRLQQRCGYRLVMTRQGTVLLRRSDLRRSGLMRPQATSCDPT